MVLYPLVTGSALRSNRAATMASADFCHRIKAPLDALSHSRHHGRSPRVLRTHLHAYACRIYVTAFRASTGLCIYSPAHPAVPPLSASCSSAQRFAYSFLQIPPRDGHPCRSANTSPCRVSRGTSTPQSECALPGAPMRKAHPLRDGPFMRENQFGMRSLHAEGGTAAAGRFDLWIFKLEPGCFECLDVVHRASIQVHQRSGIYKYL
jgi:hypothetical protein